MSAEVMQVIIQILDYIGAKGRMAELLARMIPPTCTRYVEPFCGSAALALNTRRFEVKILNDMNAHIANFWRVATSPELGPALLQALQGTTYSRTAFQQAKERREQYGANQVDPVQWAVDTYLLNKLSFNGAGESWRYKSPQAYAKNLTETTGLPLAFKALYGQTFQVYNMGAVELMKQKKVLDDPQAFIYLDPPYLEGLRSDGKLYAVDMPDVRDHINLLNAIKKAKAKIILSGYWSGWDNGNDLYDAYLLPHGWHRHLLGEYVKGCESGKDSKSKGAEWVWSSYDVVKEAPASLGYLASVNAEQNSPCIREWLAVQSASREGREVA